jgi:hypothetical protein
MTDAPVERDAEAVGQMIARVLDRTADALNAPNEARAILHLAHSFADELAPRRPVLRPPAVHQGPPRRIRHDPRTARGETIDVSAPRRR